MINCCTAVKNYSAEIVDVDAGLPEFFGGDSFNLYKWPEINLH
jgi:hypothetical protein